MEFYSIVIIHNICLYLGMYMYVGVKLIFVMYLRDSNCVGLYLMSQIINCILSGCSDIKITYSFVCCVQKR